MALESRATAQAARRPRNWEALQALEDVSPPSPSVSYGSIFLSNLASFGEIPIMLDSGIERQEGSDFGSPCRGRSVTEPYSLRSSPKHAAGHTTDQRCAAVPQSPEMWINGVRREDLSGSDLVAFGYQTPGSQSTQYLSPRSGEGYYEKRPSSSSNSQFTISAYMLPSRSPSQMSLVRSLSARSSPNYSPWMSPLPSSDTINQRFLSGNNNQRAGSPSLSLARSLSSVMFAAAPASPSITSSFVSDAQTRNGRHVKTSDSCSTITSHVEFPRSASSYDDQQSIHGSSPIRASFSRPVSPAPPLDMDNSAMLVREGPRLRTKSATTIKSHDSSHSATTAYAQSTQTQPTMLSSERTCVANPNLEQYDLSCPRIPGLPVVLSWLENVRLELWIDQEGFRLVRPVFKMSTYTCNPDGVWNREFDIADAVVYGSAEFRPVERQSYVFHHASLEPPPTFRKLTMEGDESRDYVSRRASLAVKSNGVYSVSGSESFDCTPPSPNTSSFSAVNTHNEPLKLHWRFEYMVDDCYNDAGSIKLGEKTLTPLAFSCSPGLLHPTHGKKIKLMQVFKKGLTPKLASSKMRPGEPDRGSYVPDIDDCRSARALVNKHRRAYSSSGDTLTETVDHCRYHSERPREAGISGLRKSKAISFAAPAHREP